MGAFIAMAGDSSEFILELQSPWKRALIALSERCGARQQYMTEDRFRIGFAGDGGGVFDEGQFLGVYEGLPRIGGKPIQNFEFDVEVLSKISGEFSLFFVDRSTNTITLARDRFGIHPLYYIVLPGGMVASSECKCLLPFIERYSICGSALLESIRFRWLVGEDHIIWPIKQVMSASAVQFGGNRENAPQHYRYWNIPFNPDEYPTKTLDEYSDDLYSSFHAFFENRELDRKKVGILLSGGVDSSVIAAVARERCSNVVAYTGYIQGCSNEEVNRAEFVANHLSMSCRVIDISPDKFQENLRRMVRRLEEPPRNPNNLVLMQLYESMAEEGVEVVLTGDGAEMLLGLADTLRVSKFDKKRKLVPPLKYTGLLKIFSTICENINNHLARRLARVLRQSTFEYALTLDEVSYCTAVNKILIEETKGLPFDLQFAMKKLFSKYVDFEEGLQGYQAYTFLQSSLLRHDRLAQPLNLEAISPFLSEELVDVACKLPSSCKYTNRSRPVLKNLCDRIVHPEVSKWAKLGFPVPWKDWMDGPLAASIGSPEDYTKFESVLPHKFVEKAFEFHDHEALWTIMTLRILCEEFDIDENFLDPGMN